MYQTIGCFVMTRMFRFLQFRKQKMFTNDNVSLKYLISEMSESPGLSFISNTIDVLFGETFLLPPQALVSHFT